VIINYILTTPLLLKHWLAFPFFFFIIIIIIIIIIISL